MMVTAGTEWTRQTRKALGKKSSQNLAGGRQEAGAKREERGDGNHGTCHLGFGSLRHEGRLDW
jgi:hypothetical protein